MTNDMRSTRPKSRQKPAGNRRVCLTSACVKRYLGTARTRTGLIRWATCQITRSSLMFEPYDVVRGFEEALAEYTGADFAVAVDSCTAAIFLACVFHQVETV